MAKTIEIVESLMSIGCDREPFAPEHANCQCLIARKAGRSIEALAKALEMIADIGEGSTTVNSLPNIAKIARSELQKLYGGNNEG